MTLLSHLNFSLFQVSHLSARRQELLRREYMMPTDAPSQPPHGFKGQLHACWNHKFTDADARAIVQGAGALVVCESRCAQEAPVAKLN